jgi:hypothetical protein
MRAVAGELRLLGGSGKAGTALGGNEKDAKAVEQQVNECSNESRFHSGAMISQVDQNGQLMFHNAHILGVTGFAVIASCLDQDYRQTYPRSARPPWLGAKRAFQTLKSCARHYPPHGGVRRADKRENGNPRQDRGGS